MSRVIEFVKYMHDDSTVYENIENVHYVSPYSAINTKFPENATPEEINEALEKLFDNRPFYEVGIKVSLDIDTGEMKMIGIV